MNKNYILFFVMILFGLCCISVVSANFMGSDEINYELPNGYVVGKLNSEGDINLTSNNNSIFIAKYDDNNITGYID